MSNTNGEGTPTYPPQQQTPSAPASNDLLPPQLPDTKKARVEAPSVPAGTSRWAKSAALGGGGIGGPRSLGGATPLLGGMGMGAGLGGSTPLMGGMGMGMGMGMGLGLGASSSAMGGVGLGTPSMNSAAWAGAGTGTGLGASTPLVGGAGGLGGSTPMMGGMGMGGMGMGMGMGLGLGAGAGGLGGATPLVGAGSALGLGMGSTPLVGAFGLGMQTPSGAAMMGLGAGALGLQTPMAGLGLGIGSATPFISSSSQLGTTTAAAAPSAVTVAAKAQQLEREYEAKNRYITDEDLDDTLPKLGYSIVPPPPSYVAIESERPNFYALAARALEAAGGGGSGSIGDASAPSAAAAPLETYEVPEEMGKGMPNLTPEDVTTGVFNVLLKYHQKADNEIPAADVPYYFVMQQLLCIKNGDTRQRRIGTRILTDRADIIGLDIVFECVFDRLYKNSELTAVEKHAVVKLVERIIVKYSDRISPYTRRIITSFGPLLIDSDPMIRDDGRDVISVVSSTVGTRVMYEGIKRDIDSDDERIRRLTAKVIGVMAVALGPEEVMRIVRPVCKARAVTSRLTITRAIDEMIDRLGYGIVRVAGDIGSAFADVLLRDHDNRIKTEAALAFARLCEVLTHASTATAAAAKSVGAASGSGPTSSTSPLPQPTSTSTSFSSAHDIMASETYKVILQIIREQCRQVAARPRTLSAFLKALGAMIPLLSPAEAKRQSEETLPYLINHFNSPDDDLRRIVLRVLRQCLLPAGVSSEYIRLYLLRPFFDSFWTLKVSSEDRATRLMLVATTTEVAKKAGGAEVLQYLIPMMVADAHQEAHSVQDRYPQLQELVLDAVRELLKACGSIDLPAHTVERLFESGLEALLRDSEGTCRSALLAYAAIINGCPHAVAEQYPTFGPQIASRLERAGSDAEFIRAQAADLYCMVAKTLLRDGGDSAEGGMQDLRRISNSLADRITNEDRPAPLAAALRALLSISRVIGCECLDPPPAELIAILKPVIKNRDALVQQFAVEMLEAIALMYNSFSRLPLASRHPAAVLSSRLHESLLEVATKDLFPLLACHRKATRRAAIRSFAVLALVTMGFLRVTMKLVENLTQDSREVRIQTATALSALAEKCKPFAVIPFLIYEYENCEGTELAQTIQHSVLKAIRFILEEVGPDLGKDYVFSLVPLIDRAATEQSLQMRRMALELIRSVLFVMVDAPVGGPAKAQFAQLAIHLLNLAHPNIVELLSGKKERIAEERLKLISAAVQIYEVARLIVGSAVVFQYLANGLFHPSEKVRDIYWRTYNLVYIANPEALLPAYPPLDLVIVTSSGGNNDEEADGADNANDEEDGDEKITFGRLTYRRHELYVL